MIDVKGARDHLAGRVTDPAAVGIRADGNDVIVDLERPGADFPAIVSSPTFGIVPASVWRDGGAGFGASAVTSGGYTVTAVTDAEITLQRNEHYWAGPPAIGTAHLVLDIAGRNPITAFEAGDLDYTEVSVIDAPWIPYDRTLGPDLRAIPALTLTYLGLDTTTKPFDDPRVRQAFGAAVDWRKVVPLGALSGEVPADSMVPPGIPGGGSQDWLPAYDPDHARQLLAEAGYPNGAGLPPIHFAVGNAAIGTAIAADLERELHMHVERESFDDSLTRIETDPPNMWLTGWVADYVGPNDFLGVLLESDSSNNYGKWSSPAFDQAIADALATRDRHGGPGGLRAGPRRGQGPGAGRAAVRRHDLRAVAGRAPRRNGQRPRHPAHCGHGVGAMRRAAALARAAWRSPPDSSRRRSRSLRIPSSVRRPRPRSTAMRSRSSSRRRSRRASSGSRRSSAKASAPTRSSRRSTRRHPARRRSATASTRRPARSSRTRRVELGFRLTFDDGHTVDSPTTTHLYADDRFTWKTLDGLGRPGPLDRGRQRVRAEAPRRRRAGDQERRRACSASQETDPIDFYVYADRTAFYDVIGKGAPGERRRPRAAGDPDAVREHRRRRRRRPVGEHRRAPRADPHRVRDTATKNPYHEPLHWLNEGLAVYLSQGFDAGARSSVEDCRRGPATSCR